MDTKSILGLDSANTAAKGMPYGSNMTISAALVVEMSDRIVELKQERDKYEDLYNLAIAIEYPKKEASKQKTMMMGQATNKTIRQQFEEHRPFIEDCARDGMTMAQIAKRLDVTPIRLANAFKSLDISINRLRSEGARL
tara:strand:+ start:113 stop:529 length:417 start_codon:yes stop_codon:yes gene_type:complete